MFKIFEHISSPDDPDNKADELTQEFRSRTKICQIQILLSSIKKYLVMAEEATMKVAYIKKLYAEAIQRLVKASKQIETKDTELQISKIELQVKDEQLKSLQDGSNENVQNYKEYET